MRLQSAVVLMLGTALLALAPPVFGGGGHVSQGATRFAIPEIVPWQEGPPTRVGLQCLSPEDRIWLYIPYGAAYKFATRLDLSPDMKSFNPVPMIGTEGSEQILVGSGTLRSGWKFDSDPKFPLTFKVTRITGYVYVCGRGNVSAPDGALHRLGDDESVEKCLPRLQSHDQLAREGAAQALGWLTVTQLERDKAVPALIGALNESAMEVRRDAAEALGRIGDARGLDPLTARLTTEKDDWVRDVAEESLGLIRVKTAAQKLPDGGALAALTEGLKHRWPLVRRTAAEALGRGGAGAVDPLCVALSDSDEEVRTNAARSLGAIADVRAVNPLKEALAKEELPQVKKAMEEALQRLGE
jgi:HEAT repeat protein